jgi:non-ribosomal peptide synthetase component E (peptide arylation enzyme)
MLSDGQLACVVVSAPPVLIGALWSLGNLVGHVATLAPAPQPGDIVRAIAGHAVRVAVLVPALVTGALALAFGRRVRP